MVVERRVGLFVCGSVVEVLTQLNQVQRPRSHHRPSSLQLLGIASKSSTKPLHHASGSSSSKSKSLKSADPTLITLHADQLVSSRKSLLYQNLVVVGHFVVHVAQSLCCVCVSVRLSVCLSARSLSDEMTFDLDI